MRISHKYKFVYIAIPKTGSSTIRKLLDPYSDVISQTNQGDFAHHATAAALKATFAQRGWDWDQYFKFTVVRNPWARLYSFHSYLIRVGSNPPTPYHLKNAMPMYERSVRYVKEGLTYSEKVCAGKVNLLPQVDWVMIDDKMGLDQVCKIETISEELQGIWRRLGLDLADLERIPRLNSASQKPYQEDYNSAAIERVAEKFKDDISVFDYTFNG